MYLEGYAYGNIVCQTLFELNGGVCVINCLMEIFMSRIINSYIGNCIRRSGSGSNDGGTPILSLDIIRTKKTPVLLATPLMT